MDLAWVGLASSRLAAVEQLQKLESFFTTREHLKPASSFSSIPSGSRFTLQASLSARRDYGDQRHRAPTRPIQFDGYSNFSDMPMEKSRCVSHMYLGSIPSSRLFLLQMQMQQHSSLSVVVAFAPVRAALVLLSRMAAVTGAPFGSRGTCLPGPGYTYVTLHSEEKSRWSIPPGAFSAVPPP